MAQFVLDLAWWRDPKGYRLVGSGKSQRIRRCGGQLIDYNPLQQFGSLCMTFAKSATDADGLLEFVKNFSPLTYKGLNERNGDPVRDLLSEAANMRDFLRYASLVDSELGFGLELKHGGIPFPVEHVEFRLGLEPITKKLRLRILPQQLVDALWLQLGQVLTGSSTIRQCEYCGQWFETGAGTGRRQDAKFCTYEHKIRFHSLRRSKEGRNA